MLEQLQAVSKAANSPKSPDWIPVSFKLTQEMPDGPPAVGFHARLGRGNQEAFKEGAIQRESDDKGMIDFGVVQPGDWEFILNSDVWRSGGTLNVLPGTTIKKSIVRPNDSEQKVPVSVRIDWPPDMAEQGLAIVASFQHRGFTYQPPLHWYLTNDNYPPSSAGTISVFCGPGPNKMTGIDQGGPTFWRLPAPAPSPVMEPNSHVIEPPASQIPDVKPFKRDQVYVDLPANHQAGGPRSVQSLPGTYRLQKIAVVRPRKDLAAGSPDLS